MSKTLPDKAINKISDKLNEKNPAMNQAEKDRINKTLMEAAKEMGFDSMKLADPNDPQWQKLDKILGTPSPRSRLKKRAKRGKNI